MFKNLFKKKVKTILPASTTSIPQSPQSQQSHPTTKIKPQFSYLQDLQKCLEQGCLLSHLAFISQQEISSITSIVKDLSKIHQSLKAQQLENNELKKFYDSNRYIVSNHTSIVKGIETMYEERVVGIREEYMGKVEEKEREVEETKGELRRIKDRVKELEQGEMELKEEIGRAKEQLATLEFVKVKLEQDNKILSKNIQIYQSVHTNSKIDLSSLTAKQPIPIFLQSSLSPLILSFLPVKDIISLSSTNKLSHFILHNNLDINRMLVNKIIGQARRWREETFKDIKYFESMIENINDYSIKQSALKYVYFHQKPGEYMIPTFKEFIVEEEKEKEKEKQQEQQKKKRKSSFFSLFQNKDKKQQKKINIKDLADPVYFKNIQSKIQSYFSSTIDMTSDQPLQSFRTTLLQQYQDLKSILLSNTPIIKLYQSSKFLYLQTQQLHRFCQYLFSLLLQSSKKQSSMKSEYDDIIAKEQSIKDALQIISQQKNKIQEINWLLEYDLKREKLERQGREKELGEVKGEMEKMKEGYEKMKGQNIAMSKKNEDLWKKVGKLEKYLEGIRGMVLGESAVI